MPIKTRVHARTRGSRSQTNMLVAPGDQGADLIPQNHGKPEHSPVQGQGWGSIHDGEHATGLQVDPEPWPADAAGNLAPVKLEVPEADRLDHNPTAAEVLGILRGGLGEPRVLGAVRHDDPDAAAKLEAIHTASAPLPDGWSWPARWSADPVSACARCGQPAHTTGPDARPWHPFCWGVAGIPAPRPAYQAGTRLRPRVLSLTGSLADFHRAVDLLDRDTCVEGPCRPGAPCWRHTRRRKGQ